MQVRGFLQAVSLPGPSVGSRIVATAMLEFLDKCDLTLDQVAILHAAIFNIKREEPGQ